MWKIDYGRLSELKTAIRNFKLCSLKPRSRRAWTLYVCGAVVAVGVFLFLLLYKPSAPVVLPTVEIETVTTDDVSIYGEYVGRIRAQQFVEIHARVEGYLEEMLFKEGSYIQKGQTLFIIDPKLYKAHVEKARAQLNKARAQAQKAETTVYSERRLAT